MTDLILVIFSAAIINNIIVMEMLGTDPMLSFLRKMDVARGLSLTLLIVLPVVTTTGYMVNQWILIPNHVEYLRLIVFILLILCVAGLLKSFGKKINPALNIFLPAAGINTTVLGTLLLSNQHSLNLLSATMYGIGSAIGFALVLLMLTAINERLETVAVPAPFRGMPVLLLTLALLSMGFMGFIGITDI